MTLKETIIDRAQDLPDVELRESQFSDRPALWIGRREFAHFEKEPHKIDIRLTRKVIRRLREELKDDRRVEMRGSSDWLEFSFRRRTDLDRCLELLEIARDANR